MSAWSGQYFFCRSLLSYVQKLYLCTRVLHFKRETLLGAFTAVGPLRDGGLRNQLALSLPLSLSLEGIFPGVGVGVGVEVQTVRTSDSEQIGPKKRIRFKIDACDACMCRGAEVVVLTPANSNMTSNRAAFFSRSLLLGKSERDREGREQENRKKKR